MGRHRTATEGLRTAVDCLPRHTRTAMLAAIREESIIVGAYTASGGGVCPMLGAHRRGGRTSVVSFAHAWDRYTDAPKRGSRRATPRELRTLERCLTASLRRDRDAAGADGLDAAPTGGDGAMAEAIRAHRSLLAAHAAERAEDRAAAVAHERARHREAAAREAAEAASIRAGEAALAAQAASPACEAVLRSAAAAARREAADALQREADRRAERLRREAELLAPAPKPRRRTLDGLVPMERVEDVEAALAHVDRSRVALGLVDDGDRPAHADVRDADVRDRAPAAPAR